MRQMNDLTVSNLELNPGSFRKIEFLIYKTFRILLYPIGLKFAMLFAISLHWTFKRLATTLVSHYFGRTYLNSKSAIIEAKFLQRYCTPSTIIIDFACGSAPCVPLLMSLGVRNYTGIDASKVHIESNSKKYPELKFLQQDVLDTNSLPKCDVAIVSHFLEHIENPRKFLREIRDSCRLLIVEVPDFFSDPLNMIAHRLNRPWWSDPDHEREYSLASITEIIEGAGFRVEQVLVHGGTIGVVATSSLS